MKLRPLLSVLPALMLALVLALTSQSIAVARGASAATGQMILCTGSGPVAIYTDATGKPTTAPHICPDSALNVLAGVATPDLGGPAGFVRFRDPMALRARPVPALPQATPHSRAPPVGI